MKAYISVIVFSTLFLIGCDKKKNKLSGSWKLIEVLGDPGDGSGTFNPVNSNKTLTFYENGNVSSNGSFCGISLESSTSSTGTYSESEGIINSNDCDNVIVRYSLVKNELLINYPCDEPCIEKYIKIQ